MWFSGASRTNTAESVDGRPSTRSRDERRPTCTGRSRSDASGGSESSRRAVVLAAAVALAGCADASRRDPADDGDDDSGNANDSSTRSGVETHPNLEREPVARGRDRELRREFQALPDLEIVNESDHGVTAFLAIYGQHWLDARFRATVSLRGPVHEELPVRVTFPDIDGADTGSVLVVETARGLHGTHPWHGGGPHVGLWVHLRNDDVGFHALSL